MIILRNKSKVNSANTNSQSVRTSIPLAIAQLLEVKSGDSLDWIVNMENNELTVTVKKVKP